MSGIERGPGPMSGDTNPENFRFPEHMEPAESPIETEKKTSLRQFLEKGIGVMGLVALSAGEVGAESTTQESRPRVSLEQMQSMQASINEMFGEHAPDFQKKFIPDQEIQRKLHSPEKAAEEIADIDIDPIPFRSYTPDLDQTTVIVRPEETRAFLRTFPRGFVSGEVGSISFNNVYAHEERDSLKKSTIAEFTPYTWPLEPDITFFLSARELYVKRFPYVVTHEIGHANDWNHDNELLPEERAQLLLDVSKRVSAPDRFNSAYVESISLDDAQEEHYARATEYWAEISSQYFMFPENLPLEDFKIVDRIVKIGDPSFDTLALKAGGNQRASMSDTWMRKNHPKPSPKNTSEKP